VPPDSVQAAAVEALVTHDSRRPNHHAVAAMRGMSWMALNTILARAVVFLSQLVLGYLLSPADFGLYALALSVSAALSGLRNGGTVQLMTAEGVGYRAQLAEQSRYALAVNGIVFVALLLLAWPAGTTKGIPTLGWLVAAIALSFPLGTFASVYRTELAILGRFRELAVLNAVSTVLWQLEVIGLAALGFGVYSLVVPMVLQGVVEGVIGWHYLGHWPLRGPTLTTRQFLALFRRTGWIMLGLVMFWVGLAGPYYVAGLFADPATVGFFFFGFQLAYTLFTLFNNSIETVLPPVLALLNADPAAQTHTTRQMLRTLMVVSIPLAGAVVLGAHAAVHLLWAGRWDRSVPVVIAVVLSLPGWLGFQIVRALLEARGRWVARLVILSVYGFGSCAAVAFAARLTHDLGDMARALAAFYAVFGLVLLTMLPALLGVAAREIASLLFRPLALGVLCAGLGLAAARGLPAGTGDLAREMAALFVFCVVAAAANWIWFRSEWREAVGTLLGSRTTLMRTAR
jgi:O-antigen/teichoic acid export membrane protein